MFFEAKSISGGAFYPSVEVFCLFVEVFYLFVGAFFLIVKTFCLIVGAFFLSLRHFVSSLRLLTSMEGHLTSSLGYFVSTEGHRLHSDILQEAKKVLVEGSERCFQYLFLWEILLNRSAKALPNTAPATAPVRMSSGK